MKHAIEKAAYEALSKAQSNGYSEELEDIACKASLTALLFYRTVPGANLEKCQDAACKSAFAATMFARNVKEANILKCQKAACVDFFGTMQFLTEVSNADLKEAAKYFAYDPFYSSIMAEVFEKHPQFLEIIKDIPEWQSFFMEKACK